MTALTEPTTAWKYKIETLLRELKLPAKICDRCRTDLSTSICAHNKFKYIADCIKDNREMILGVIKYLTPSAMVYAINTVLPTDKSSDHTYLPIILELYIYDQAAAGKLTNQATVKYVSEFVKYLRQNPDFVKEFPTLISIKQK